MVSERVRKALAEIARDADSNGEPLVHAWNDLRIGYDDACGLCDCIEVYDVIDALCERYGDRAPHVIRNFVRLLAVPATVETLQMMAQKEEA
jgi:hypothetical protein